MPQKSSPSTSSIKVPLLILGILIVSFASYYFIKIYFDVKEIDVHEERSNRPIHLRGLNALDDYNLIISNTAETVGFIKESNPTVKSLKLDKEFPNKIIITLSFYTPFAALKVDRGYFTISSDGTVLSTSTTPPQALPQITYYQLLNISMYKVGSKLDFEDIKAALTFLQSSIDLGMKTSKIEISGLYMIALYADKEKIIFSQEKDINIQKYQFETIIKEFRGQGKSFKSLDVRFDKPVVVF